MKLSTYIPIYNYPQLEIILTDYHIIWIVDQTMYYDEFYSLAKNCEYL